MRLGIAGAGSIVPTFLQAAALIPEMTFTAICASERSREKMEKLQASYGIERIYFSYDEMLEDPQLDVIYVAVPNDLHFDFARKALMKGLHVICEKPFCVRAEELKELIALAEEKNLFLFEAISNLYMPNYRKVEELVPTLGELRIVEMNYTQYSSRYDAFRRGEIHPVFDASRHGGALMDLNVYNIHFVTGLLGKPESVQYYPNIQRGVDTSGMLIMKYPTVTCVLTAAKDCRSQCRMSIQGEEGYISSDSPSNVFADFFCTMGKDETTHYALNTRKERLYYELLEFVRMYTELDYAFGRKQLEHSLVVQEILDEARAGLV